jgi:hypothetical protein
MKMQKKAHTNKATVFLFLCGMGIMVISFIASCGKGPNAAPSSANIQFQVLNLSPDLLPVNLFIGVDKQNTNAFTYSVASGYFSLKTIDTPIQIRSTYASVSTTNIISLDSILKPNFKYSLFITGFRADNSIKSIFTVDNAPISTVGRGKIRFVNASPGANGNGLDITANGTMAFKNQQYTKVSDFIEIPPGTYDFKIMPTGTATVISDLPNVSILDGKVYTLYSYGVYGGADSVKFSSAVLSNK